MTNTTMSKAEFTVKKISTKETIPIRLPVLRPGMTEADCVFEGDELDSTVHLGIFKEKQLVGVASFMDNKHPELAKEQFQLRGMAVLKDFQGEGYGKLLLQEGEKLTKDSNKFFLWFNARLTARHFYEKHGYQTLGEPFEIKGIGTHFVMYKKLK